MKTEGMYDPFKVLTFENITNEEFQGVWNGKTRVFKAHEKAQLTEYLAEHYAKQLIDKMIGQEFDNAGKDLDKIKEAEKHYINENYKQELEAKILTEARTGDEEDVMLIKAAESKKMVETPERKAQLRRLGDKSKVVRMGDAGPTMVVLNQEEPTDSIPKAFSEL